MGSSCQPHEPTSVWLPASYPCGMPSLGHLQFWMVRDVRGLSVLSLPDIQIGSFLPTWKNISPCGNFSPSIHHQLVCPIGFTDLYSNVSPEAKCPSVPGPLSFSLHISYAISSTGKTWLYPLFF